MTKRLAMTAVATATLIGTLMSAMPASAAGYYTYYYPTYRTTSYSTWANYYNWLYRYARTSYQKPTTQYTTPTPTKTTTPTTTNTTAPTTNSTTAGLTAEEQQMLNLVNAERSKAGLPALKADLQLTKLARLKSQDMISKNYFSHQSPTYGSPFDMLKSYGVSYRTAGENIAGNSSVSGAHTALMNSSGHRANILGSQFNYVGIGIVKGGNYGMMFTQLFVGR